MFCMKSQIFLRFFFIFFHNLPTIRQPDTILIWLRFVLMTFNCIVLYSQWWTYFRNNNIIPINSQTITLFQKVFIFLFFMELFYSLTIFLFHSNKHATIIRYLNYARTTAIWNVHGEDDEPFNITPRENNIWLLLNLKANVSAGPASKASFF